MSEKDREALAETLRNKYGIPELMAPEEPEDDEEMAALQHSLAWRGEE